MTEPPQARSCFQAAAARQDPRRLSHSGSEDGRPCSSTPRPIPLASPGATYGLYIISHRDEEGAFEAESDFPSAVQNSDNGINQPTRRRGVRILWESVGPCELTPCYRTDVDTENLEVVHVYSALSAPSGAACHHRHIAPSKTGSVTSSRCPSNSVTRESPRTWPTLQGRLAAGV